MSAGLYVPLQANFFGDDKVVLCSPLAKLVYLQGLCIAKLMGTDGIVTRAQLKRECDRVQHIDRHIAELVSVGLWTEVSLPDVNTASIHGQERVNTAYATNAWLKHNKSREWIEAYRTARAEDGKRGGRPPKSSPAPDDGPKGNPFESEKGNPFESEKGNPFESEKGNPFENPENEKGTENLEGRQREERGKTESKTATAPGPVPADNSREDDPRLVAVVGLLAKRETANASGVRNPGGYEHDARKRIQTERGNEIRALLRDRPSASVETIVDLLERDRGYHVTVDRKSVVERKS